MNIIDNFPEVPPDRLVTLITILISTIKSIHGQIQDRGGPDTCNLTLMSLAEIPRTTTAQTWLPLTTINVNTADSIHGQVWDGEKLVWLT